MNYKDFKGAIEYNSDDKYYFGELLVVDDLVSYEGKDLAELEHNFHVATESHVEFRNSVILVCV